MFVRGDDVTTTKIVIIMGAKMDATQMGFVTQKLLPCPPSAGVDARLSREGRRTRLYE
jgi:hypothetical protein